MTRLEALALVRSMVAPPLIVVFLRNCNNCKFVGKHSSGRVATLWGGGAVVLASLPDSRLAGMIFR
jgi:hypothetical protein